MLQESLHPATTSTNGSTEQQFPFVFLGECFYRVLLTQLHETSDHSIESISLPQILQPFLTARNTGSLFGTPKALTCGDEGVIRTTDRFTINIPLHLAIDPKVLAVNIKEKCPGLEKLKIFPHECCAAARIQGKMIDLGTSDFKPLSANSFYLDQLKIELNNLGISTQVEDLITKERLTRPATHHPARIAIINLNALPCDFNNLNFPNGSPVAYKLDIGTIYNLSDDAQIYNARKTTILAYTLASSTKLPENGSPLLSTDEPFIFIFLQDEDSTPETNAKLIEFLLSPLENEIASRRILKVTV